MELSTRKFAAGFDQMMRDVSASLTATGSDITGALQLLNGFNYVGTVPVSSGVQLAPDNSVGDAQAVLNNGANILSVYPPLGDQFLGKAVNAPMTFSPLVARVMRKIQPGLWMSFAVGDDEGTWTPTVTCVTPGDLSVAYTNRTSYWARNGRMVDLQANFTFTPTYSSASGAISITGLPFQGSSLAVSRGNLVLTGFNKASYTQVNTAIGVVGTTIAVVASGMNQAAATLAIADLTAGSGGVVTVILTHRYFI